MAPSRSPVSARITAWCPKLCFNPAESLSRRQIASSSFCSRMAPSSPPDPPALNPCSPTPSLHRPPPRPRRRSAHRRAPPGSFYPGGVVEPAADPLLLLPQPHGPLQVPSTPQNHRPVPQPASQPAGVVERAADRLLFFQQPHRPL